MANLLALPRLALQLCLLLGAGTLLGGAEGCPPSEDGDADGDGHALSVDCDDTDPSINPNAPELCDGLDNDCSGLADDLPPDTHWLIDRDLDGFGALEQANSCADPPAVTSMAGDCDDQDSGRSPGLPERCSDGVDNDCNPLTSDGRPHYRDSDGDGFGDPAEVIITCLGAEPPEGWVPRAGDCDDASPDVSPARPEICGDGRDEDCSGRIDDLDRDNDGNSDCRDDDGDGLSEIEGDCRDDDSRFFSGAPEAVAGSDNDCDGAASQAPPWGSRGRFDIPALGGPLLVELPAAIPSGADASTPLTIQTVPVPRSAQLDAQGLALISPLADSRVAPLSPYITITPDIAFEAGMGAIVTYPFDASFAEGIDGLVCLDHVAVQQVDPTSGQLLGTPLLVWDNPDDPSDGCNLTAGTITVYQPHFSTYVVEGFGALLYAPLTEPDDVQPVSFDSPTTINPGIYDWSGEVWWWYQFQNSHAQISMPSFHVTPLDSRAPISLASLDPNHPEEYPYVSTACIPSDAEGDEGNCVPHPGLWQLGFVGYNGTAEDWQGELLVYSPAMDYPWMVEGCQLPPQGPAVEPSATPSPTPTWCMPAHRCGDLTREQLSALSGYDAPLRQLYFDCVPARIAADPHQVDADGDGWTMGGGDCEDGDASIHPDAPEVWADGVVGACDGVDQNCNGADEPAAVIYYYADGDGDGYGDMGSAYLSRDCQDMVGLTTTGGDCNDSSIEVHPDAEEQCNLIDDNCNALIDEGVTETLYRDADGDGFGDPDDTLESCAGEVPGYVPYPGDCNDGGACAPAQLDCIRDARDTHPRADELCDGSDNDCDRRIDEGVATAEICDYGLVKVDDDCDGQIDEGYDTILPDGVPDCWDPDGDTYSAVDGDCQEVGDGAADVNPGAVEECDHIDNNCDGWVDATMNGGVLVPAEDAPSWCADDDHDGFGNPYTETWRCQSPGEGYTNSCTDCDDGRASVKPGAPTICGDGIDQDCDTIGGDFDAEVDEGQETYYPDQDSDTYGDTSQGVMACPDDPPPLSVTRGGDCDDHSSAVNPGRPEVCNGRDDDCDRIVDEGFDLDGDGYSTCRGGELDCNDGNAAINPGATDTCENGLDDDCNGQIDDSLNCFDPPPIGAVCPRDCEPNETCLNGSCVWEGTCDGRQCGTGATGCSTNGGCIYPCVESYCQANAIGCNSQDNCVYQ